MKKVLGLFVVLAVAQVAQAADIEAGKQVAATVCAGCHGANGVSVSDAISNLAAQRPAYIEAQLKAFKDGTRKHLGATSNIMNVIQLSAQDIANVAAYLPRSLGLAQTPRQRQPHLHAEAACRGKGDQSQGRQDARSNDLLDAAYGSRRGDRIATLFAAVHKSAIGRKQTFTRQSQSPLTHVKALPE